MKTTVSVTQAQAQLPRILRSHETVVVQRHDEVVAYIVPRDRMEALVETLELLADPRAMRAIRRDRAGKGKYFPLASLDEDEG